MQMVDLEHHIHTSRQGISAAEDGDTILVSNGTIRKDIDLVVRIFCS